MWQPDLMFERLSLCVEGISFFFSWNSFPTSQGKSASKVARPGPEDLWSRFDLVGRMVVDTVEPASDRYGTVDGRNPKQPPFGCKQKPCKWWDNQPQLVSWSPDFWLPSNQYVTVIPGNSETPPDQPPGPVDGSGRLLHFPWVFFGVERVLVLPATTFGANSFDGGIFGWMKPGRNDKYFLNGSLSVEKTWKNISQIPSTQIFAGFLHRFYTGWKLTGCTGYT